MLVKDYKGRGRRAHVRADDRQGSWLFRLFMAWFRRDA
jgi:hypothetical protein